MSGTRVPFDPRLPFIVAAQELAYGPKCFVRGEPFPWRELGVNEYDLLLMWRANQVDAVEPVAKAVAFTATPGERVTTPSKHPQRERARR